MEEAYQFAVAVCQAKSHASRVDAFAAEVKTSAAQQVALLQRMSAARATAVDSEKQRLAAMRRRQRGVNKVTAARGCHVPSHEGISCFE